LYQASRPLKNEVFNSLRPMRERIVKIEGCHVIDFVRKVKIIFFAFR